MEKKILKQKQRTILRKNFIILLLLVLVLFEGKILYDNGLLDSKSKGNININENFQNSESINIEKEEEKEENKFSKDNSWYIENYSYLLNKIKTDLIGEDLTYLYKKNYTAAKIKNTVKLNMAYQILSDELKNEENGFITIDAKELEKSFINIFGKDIEFKNEDFESSCISYIYNESLDKYLAIDKKCDEDKKTIEKIITEIKEEEDNIVIKAIIGIHNKEDNTISNIETTFSEKYKKDFSDYKKDLDTYLYTFVKEQDSYYFNKIQKEN